MEEEKINFIVAQLTTWLREKVNSDGMSQNKLAHQTHISQPTINSYLNDGKLPGASLDYILRLFPELQRPILSYLESRGSGIQQVANGNFLSTITQTAGGSPAGDAEALRDRVIRSIIDLELPAEVQQLVLKTIKNA